MKLYPLSPSHGNGPQTPPVKGNQKDHSHEDPMERYHKERMAFISAMKRSPPSPGGHGSLLLVNLTLDPQSEVALAACRTMNHILGLNGRYFDGPKTLKALYMLLESLLIQEIHAGSTSFLVQTEAFLALDALWRSIDLDHIAGTLVQDLAEQCWRICQSCLKRICSERDTVDEEARTSQGEVMAAAVQAIAASCRRQQGDCLEAIHTILQVCTLSYKCDDVQESAFGLFSEKAISMPRETLDAVMLHAVAWLRDAHARATTWTTGSSASETYDMALTAVVSFVETMIAQGSISEAIDAEVCALLCAFAEDRIQERGINGNSSAPNAALNRFTPSSGSDREEEAGEESQSATIILQVLARLVNECEMFSLVVAKKRKLLEAICSSCLDDLEGPMLLPSLFCIGHVSKVSADACNLVSLELRETKGIDVIGSLVVVLAHAEQGNVRQVAAWVLGVLGSSSSTAAQHVASAGGILTMMDVTQRNSSDKTLSSTCYESCTATVSRLDSLETLVALLRLELEEGNSTEDKRVSMDDAGPSHDKGDEERGSHGEERPQSNESDASRGTTDGTSRDGQAPGSVPCNHVPPRVQEALFDRIAGLLENDVSLRTEFVQRGALEALISLGEMRPELDPHMAKVCGLYPQELVDRCSPKYMRKLIEKYKRESCCAIQPDGVDVKAHVVGEIDDE